MIVWFSLTHTALRDTQTGREALLEMCFDRLHSIRCIVNILVLHIWKKEQVSSFLLCWEFGWNTSPRDNTRALVLYSFSCFVCMGVAREWIGSNSSAFQSFCNTSDAVAVCVSCIALCHWRILSDEFFVFYLQPCPTTLLSLGLSWSMGCMWSGAALLC